MKIICKIQRHLATAWRATDSGEWVFTLCRQGLEEELGRRLKVGEKITVNMDITMAEIDAVTQE